MFISKSASKKSQVGMEYMIVVGFITLAIITVLGFSVLFSSQIKERIRLNHAESFAVGLINSAESVFFAGEPSKKTIKLYLPDGVDRIYLVDDYTLVMEVSVSSGQNVRGFSSKVPLQINGVITTGEGTRNFVIEATSTNVRITPF